MSEDLKRRWQRNAGIPIKEEEESENPEEVTLQEGFKNFGMASPAVMGGNPFERSIAILGPQGHQPYQAKPQPKGSSLRNLGFATAGLMGNPFERSGTVTREQEERDIEPGTEDFDRGPSAQELLEQVLSDVEQYGMAAGVRGEEVISSDTVNSIRYFLGLESM